jgi:hypothetical protein
MAAHSSLGEAATMDSASRKRQIARKFGRARSCSYDVKGIYLGSL